MSYECLARIHNSYLFSFLLPGSYKTYKEHPVQTPYSASWRNQILPYDNSSVTAIIIHHALAQTISKA